MGMQDSLNGNVTDSYICVAYIFIHMHTHVLSYIRVYKCIRV